MGRSQVLFLCLTVLFLISEVSAFGVGVGYSDTICEPNSLKCSEDGMNILRCNSFGDGLDIDSTCESGKICGFDKGNIKCLTIKNTRYYLDTFFGKDTPYVIYIILLILIGIIIYLLRKEKLK